MSLNDVARTRHNTVLDQRVQAINNAVSRYATASIDTLMFIETLQIGSNITKPVIDDIRTMTRVVSNVSTKLRSDIKVIGRCNNYWIQMQPIVCDDDMLRYLDFMQVSYHATVKDIIWLNEYIDNNILAINDHRKYLATLRSSRLLTYYFIAFGLILLGGTVYFA